MLHLDLRRFVAIASSMVAAVLFSSVAPAQVTTGIHGLVKDASGAVVPKAAIKLVDTATNIARNTISGEDGSFVFVNIPAGKFNLTAIAPGFEASILESVIVDTGRITDASMMMQVGATTETVQVSASAVQLETTSNEIGTTVNVSSINTLPYTSRDALNFALLMPGAQTVSGGSTFNGLPNASMNITLDGMNNNSQRFKSGGTSFYAFAPERLDAVEEATVSTSGIGADASGQGAMEIRFTTKRGTDKFHFHVSEQFYNEDLNANTWFNNARGIRRPVSRTDDYSGNMGGPLLPWIRPLKGKLFFFVNFEDVPQPSSSIISNTVVTPDALNGNFTYLGTDGQNHTVNLLNVAAANGFPSTPNPVTQSLINGIKATDSNPAVVAFLPVVGSPYLQTMQWNTGLNITNLYPTARLDYRISPKFTYTATWNMRHQKYQGIPSWPGGPVPDNYPNAEAYSINTYLLSNSLAMTLSPRLLNNLTFGIQTNNEYFFNPSNPFQWASYGNVNVSFPTGLFSPTTLINSNLPQTRNNPVTQLTDTFTWVKGKHTFNIGAAFLHTWFFEITYLNGSGIPNIGLGVSGTDPINNIIQSALPFVNTNGSDPANAKSLYAMLTGRISSYSVANSVNEITHQYAPFSPGVQRFVHNNTGTFFADTWRVRPNLTVNYGLRWEFDSPTHNTNGVDVSPGSLYGPSLVQFQPGVLGGNLNPAFNVTGSMYHRDFVNPAPNIGVSWAPHAEGGLLGKVFGQDKSVFSAAYRIAYYDEGMNSISNIQSANPGASQSGNGAAAIAAAPGAYTVGGAPPPLVTSPSCFCFPLPLSNYVLNGGTSWNYVNPNLKTPYVQDWNIRFQRELGRGTILSLSYIGNKATHIWHYQNVNETNTVENGFINEFKNAQSNLAIANGLSVAQMTAQPYVALKTQNFANQGLAGQVALPILQTAFGANGTNAALAASSGFGSSTFVTDLQQGLVGTFASSLASTSTNTYYCRLVGSNFAPCAAQGFTQATAYAMNTFRANPFVNTVNYQNDDANSNYNGFQIDVRHNTTHGLTADANYVWSHTLGTVMNSSDQTSTTTWSTLRNGHLNYGPTPFDQRHKVNVYATYDLPVGRGKWLNVDNKVLDRIVGGWTLGSINTITSGSPVLVTGGRATFNTTADGGVLFGNGMTMGQLLQRTSSQTSGFVASCTCIKTNTSDIVQANGTVNPAYFQAGQTPGVIGGALYYTGKTGINLALSLQKTMRITERVNFRLYADASNWLNHPFFSQGSLSLTASSFGNITSASGNRTMFVRWSMDF